VGDTQHPMFAEGGPQCWMHKQAAWIPDFWPKDPATEEPLFEPGVDSSFFYFPPIDPEFGSPVLGGGDMFVMFDDRPEVRALMEYLATAESAQAWIEVGGFVSPNKSVPLSWYTTYPSSGLAEIVSGATTLRFDGSDVMPAEVGQGTFWSGMVDWVANNGEGEEQIFQEIEDGWPSG
jgi:alpha-glucoside transport system substrate-binding protein